MFRPMTQEAALQRIALTICSGVATVYELLAPERLGARPALCDILGRMAGK